MRRPRAAADVATTGASRPAIDMGLGLDAALQEGLISLLKAAFVMGGGLLLASWAASSRYFEVLLILAAFAILAYAAH